MWPQQVAVPEHRAPAPSHRQREGVILLRAVHHEPAAHPQAVPDEVPQGRVGQLRQVLSRLPRAVEVEVRKEARGIVVLAGAGDIQTLLHPGTTGRKRAHNGEARHRLRTIHLPRRLHHLQDPHQPHRLLRQVRAGAAEAAEAVDQHAMVGTNRNLRRM